MPSGEDSLFGFISMMADEVEEEDEEGLDDDLAGPEEGNRELWEKKKKQYAELAGAFRKSGA